LAEVFLTPRNQNFEIILYVPKSSGGKGGMLNGHVHSTLAQE